MQKPIEPSTFARIMKLPNAVRHDVLEFLGSTPVSQQSLDTLIANIVATQIERRHIVAAR